MTELDATERALGLALARVSPTESDRRRVRAGIAVPAGAPLTSPGSALPAAPRSVASSWLLWSGLGGALLGLGIGAGIGFGLGFARGHATPAAVTSSARSLPAGSLIVPAPQAAAPAQLAPQSEAPAEMGPGATANPRREPKRPRGASASQPQEAELALLQRSERALRARQAELALALLDELDVHYPKTRFGEERRAARILARCQAGDASALSAAQAFLQAHPRSVYSKRILETCGGGEP
jgi:hypothetical protein